MGYVNLRLNKIRILLIISQYFELFIKVKKREMFDLLADKTAFETTKYAFALYKMILPRHHFPHA